MSEKPSQEMFGGSNAYSQSIWMSSKCIGQGPNSTSYPEVFAWMY